jgi:hypothetical protein
MRAGSVLTAGLRCAQVDAVLAAATESGITLAHLQAAASGDAPLRSMHIAIDLDALRITAPGDKLTFTAALYGLWQHTADGA